MTFVGPARTAPTWMDAAADVCIDYACALMSGSLLGDWEEFDTAATNYLHMANVLCPLAIAASSGAADECEYFTALLAQGQETP